MGDKPKKLDRVDRMVRDAERAAQRDRDRVVAEAEKVAREAASHG